ncbi:YheC/YheD family endospore coat-associated protein [Paenibacillus albus]|uniref:ATP-grasp domain-containing protein n=1 Tax=Paenibacillus albus TaxID=2495582 RepID=A0A3S9A609_9BACL|nr:YheC/YheD family protein [Paenibacillus albus]AZN41154.1 hypothetical protein EJC50_16875 [Paenibacillus albus]
MKSHSYIGILVQNKRDRKGILQLYQRYCPEDIELYAFCTEDVQWRTRHIKGLSLNRREWKERLFPFPDAIYNRIFNRNTDSLKRLVEAIGPNRCFNMINFFNKWTMYNLLKETEVSACIPETFVYKPEELGNMLYRFGLVFIKPFYGAQGKSVFRVVRMANEEIHVSMHSLTASSICGSVEETRQLLSQHLSTGTYLIQEGIRTRLWNNKYFDIRVLMQKDGFGDWTVTNIASRVAYRQYFNTAVCEDILDARALLPQLFERDAHIVVSQTLHQVALSAAKEAEAQLGLLGELSVDFVFDMQDKLWIIEMNGKPHKSIYNEIPGVTFTTRVYERPLEYAGYLAQAAAEEPQHPHTEETTLLHAACDSIGIETSAYDIVKLLSPKQYPLYRPEDY